MKKNDWKDRLNVVFSTNPTFNYEEEKDNSASQNSIPASKQTLRVELDKRNGKPATLITEFQGTNDELKELAKTLKIKCGVGGSQRDGEILIQGDFRLKVAELLSGMGYKVKKINFK